ncbi:MAG: YihY/virulence factor BrkB family protein [Deltaproteobacteria bacterium]|nr:YihY/virulence factor BrkB family protein [Deltaproteobacteria bacterium]
MASQPASSLPDLRHPRGRLAPPLPADAPPWKRVARALRRLGHGLLIHDALQAAPAMAFHFFLSLMPLLVFVGYVVGSIAKRRGVSVVLAPVLDNLPDAAEGIVKSEVGRLAGANALGPLAAVGFLWIASGGTQGLMHAMETVVGAPRRPWWKKRLIALGWVVGALAMFAGSGFAVIQWDRVVHPPDPIGVEIPVPGTGPEKGVLKPASSSDPHVASPHSSSRVLPSADPRATSTDPLLGSPTHPAPRTAAASDPHGSTGSKSTRSDKRERRRKIIRSGGERALGLTLSILFATAVLAVFYRLAVSHSKRVARRVLPGALLAVVLWLFISWVFGLYVKSLAEYAVYYGSLAAVAVLLVWLWLTSLTILIGAELNAQLEGLRD